MAFVEVTVLSFPLLRVAGGCHGCNREMEQIVRKEKHMFVLLASHRNKWISAVDYFDY
jgi:hypothetical protein